MQANRYRLPIVHDADSEETAQESGNIVDVEL